MADFSQKLIWTALPNGTADDHALLTAYASPRLTLTVDPAAPLDNWPDFMIWAELMLNAEFQVDFGGTALPAERVSEPDPNVWQALFTSETVVRNHAYEDMRGSRILSYPVARVNDFVSDTYADIGLDAVDELPEPADLFPEIRDLARPQEDDETYQRMVLSALQDPKRKDYQDVSGAFQLQEIYHMPLAVRDPVGGSYTKQGPDDIREDAQWRHHKFEPLPDPMDFADRIDFHEVVSAITQYPRLMRLTGIAVDLRIPLSDMPGGALTDRVMLNVTRPSPSADNGVDVEPDTTPGTITEWNAPRFFAVRRSSASPISNRMLNLDGERFRVIQMDVDGAGIKLRNTARSFSRRGGRKENPELDDRAGVANIRTAGLQLVEVDRHLSLDELFNNNGAMNDALVSNSPIDLFADDILRGFHADIIDLSTGAPWQSLCRRDGTYELLNSSQTLNFEDEEGMIRLAAQEAADPNEALFQGVRKISELIFAWSGWSLTTPRPGLAISNDDLPETAANTAPPRIPLETSFRVRAGSLPLLRFGHEYQVKVRVADLAGNATAFTPGDTAIPNEASPPETFRRYEPVGIPVNALVDGPGGVEPTEDGEAMTRLAIRSFNETPADNTIPTTDQTRRHVIPPRTSHVMAEMHGALDDPSGRPDPSRYGMLASRDENLVEVKVLHEDPEVGASDLVKYSAMPESFTLPYLPDVLARDAVVRLDFLPGTGPTQRVNVPYYMSGTWPDAEPFKILIHEDAAAPIAFDDGTRTLTVPLAKAEMMRVRISHRLEDADLDLMALWHSMRFRPRMNEDLRAALRERILRGDHWMFTPWLEMELVHAVQKPLQTPAFLSLGASRSLGDTAATINYRSPIHAKSTDKVELFGRWREPRDIPALGAPQVLNQSGTAFDTLLERGDFPSGTMSGVGQHPFEDTRFRRLRYRMEAPTRYREFMPPAIRMVEDSMTVVSEPRDVFVPNAAIPPVPEIVEVVPTFGWSRTSRLNQVSSFRSGGGLRVWLKRPWFQTGFGEMLGVLVAPSDMSKSEVTGPKSKFVTQWGMDPIWRAGTITSPSPPLNTFTRRLTGGPIPEGRSPAWVPEEERDLPATFARLQDVPLPESGGTRVDVAAHPVNFDPDRDMYYCDISLRPGGAYYPFVKLVMSRMHPVSTEGAHLSPAVVADHMQLAPDRLLIMTTGSRKTERTLQLFGNSYTRSPHEQENPSVDARPVIKWELQVRDPDIEGELAWSRLERAVIDDFTLTPILNPDTAARMPVELSESLSIIGIGDVDEITMAELRPQLDIFLQLRPPLMWEQTIRLPRRRPGEEWRVLITEYERHAVDDDRDDLPAGSPDPELRLVYAETLPL